MATIDDLDYESISEMSTNEAIELLSEIRMNRRMPKKATAKVKATKARKKTPELNQQQAAELLKMLEGK